MSFKLTNFITVTTSGNLGLSATPKSTNANGTSMQINNAGLVWHWQGDGIDSMYISQNMYYDGVSWKRMISGYGSLMRLNGNTGDTLFYQTTTGAADSAISDWINPLSLKNNGSVGIGTTSTEGKLTINYTAAELPSSGTTSNSAIQIISSLNNQLNIGLNTVSGEYGSFIQASDNNLAVPYPLHLQPNGGNVGIGITPYTQNLIAGSLDLNGGAGVLGYDKRAYLTSNIVYNSGWKVKEAGYGAFILLGLSDGSFGFYNTTQGANAGDAVTETARLTISSGGTSTFKVSADRNLAIKYDTNITLSAQSDSGSPESLRVYADTFKIFTSTTTLGLTERMRITSGGDVGIGVTPTDTHQIGKTSGNLQLRIGTSTTSISPLVRFQGQTSSSVNRFADIQLDTVNDLLSFFPPSQFANVSSALDLLSGGDVQINNLIKFVDPTAGSAGTPQFKTLLSYQYSTVNALSTIKGGNEASGTNGTYLQFFVNSSAAVNTPLNLLTLQSSFSNGTNANFNCDVSLADTKYIQLNNTSTDWRLRADNAGRFVIQTSGGGEFFKISSSGDTTLTASYSGGTFPFRVGYLDGSSTFTPTFSIADNGETTIMATSTSGLILAQAGQSYYHNIRNQGDGLYIGVDDGGQGGSGADLRIAIKGSEKMRITSGGNINIGSGSLTQTAYQLRVDSDFDNGFYLNAGTSSSNHSIYIDKGNQLKYHFKVRGDGEIGTGSDTNSPANNSTSGSGNVFINAAGTMLTVSSSKKFKNTITDATHGLSDVLRLRSVTYKSNNTKIDGDRLFGGFIAEEVENLGLTEFVHYDDEDKPKSLHYANMVSLLTKAIQEQQTIIEYQKSLIDGLTTRIEALED